MLEAFRICMALRLNGERWNPRMAAEALEDPDFHALSVLSRHNILVRDSAPLAFQNAVATAIREGLLSEATVIALVTGSGGTGPYCEAALENENASVEVIRVIHGTDPEEDPEWSGEIIGHANTPKDILQEYAKWSLSPCSPFREMGWRAHDRLDEVA